MQRAEYLYRLEDKYDQICEFRSKYPQIIRMAEQKRLKKYNDMSNEERAYYYYVEMIVGFIEVATYMAFIAKSITKKVYNNFIFPMIKVKVNYNRTLIESFTNNPESLISDHSRKQIKNILNQF